MNNQEQKLKPATQQNKKRDSMFALIASIDFTIEMAIQYLFRFRDSPTMLETILKRIEKFPDQEILCFMPTIIFIMTTIASTNSSVKIFENHFQRIGNSSLAAYLRVRWGYGAFLQNELLQKLRNRLDTSLINRIKFEQDENKPIQARVQNLVKQKETLSDFIGTLNRYYEKLLSIPQKLLQDRNCLLREKAENLKSRLNQKLKEYLLRIQTKFQKKYYNTQYPGVILPVFHNSSIQETKIITKTITEKCFVFSTKQRIPFKVIFQTVSFHDLSNEFCNKLKWLPPSKSKSTKQEQTNESIQNKKKSLVLPHSYFGREWLETCCKIRSESHYKNIQSYQIYSFIIKSGDDMRQQYMAMQLVRLFQKIIVKQNLKIWVRSYQVIPFSSESGIIQFVQNTKTVSGLKQLSHQKSLRTIYKQIFGQNWQVSITNFTRSLAGYSLLQYLFQIKDRHNNNILIDSEGHIVHIDFSFILSNSPGNLNFEKAPFKLTSDYLELMQGRQSDIFQHFKFLFTSGLKYIRKYEDQFLETLRMMSKCQDMKCFQYFDQEALRGRFHQKATDQELQKIVQNIISQAYSSYSTNNYDLYQWYTNQIHN